MRLELVVIGCGCAVLAVASPTAAQRSLDGCWLGKVGSGTQIARVVLEVGKSGAPSLVHVMGRALSSDTLRDFAVHGDSVAFGFGTGERETSVATVLGADGALVGEFTRAGTTHPLKVKRSGGKPDPATALMGYWNGALMSGGSKVLTTGLQFRPAACGQVYVTLDSPDQGATDLPITAIALVGDSLRFEMEYLNGAFAGTVSADRTRIAGTWTQGGNALDLELTKQPKN